MLRFLFMLAIFICGAGQNARAQQCVLPLEQGRASWYGSKFEGKKTANGEIFAASAFTAAHPSVPFGTYLKVENIKNGRSVLVKVNDRGHFAPSRVIDLSEAAAREIGIRNKGIGSVVVYSCDP